MSITGILLATNAQCMLCGVAKERGGNKPLANWTYTGRCRAHGESMRVPLSCVPALSRLPVCMLASSPHQNAH